MSSAWYGRGALASESLDRLLRASGSRSAESTRRAARPSTSTSTPMFKKLPIRRSRRRPILVRRADSPRSSLGGATLTQQPRSSAVSLLSLTSSSPSVNVRPGEESSLSLMAWDEKPLKNVVILSLILSVTWDKAVAKTAVSTGPPMSSGHRQDLAPMWMRGLTFFRTSIPASRIFSHFETRNCRERD